MHLNAWFWCIKKSRNRAFHSKSCICAIQTSLVRIRISCERLKIQNNKWLKKDRNLFFSCENLSKWSRVRVTVHDSRGYCVHLPCCSLFSCSPWVQDGCSSSNHRVHIPVSRKEWTERRLFKGASVKLHAPLLPILLCPGLNNLTVHICRGE